MHDLGRSTAEMYSGLLINLCLTEVNVWKSQLRLSGRESSTCCLKNLSFHDSLKILRLLISHVCDLCFAYRDNYWLVNDLYISICNCYIGIYSFFSYNVDILKTIKKETQCTIRDQNMYLSFSKLILIF